MSNTELIEKIKTKVDAEKHDYESYCQLSKECEEYGFDVMARIIKDIASDEYSHFCYLNYMASKL